MNNPSLLTNILIFLIVAVVCICIIPLLITFYTIIASVLVFFVIANCLIQVFTEIFIKPRKATNDRNR